MHARVVVGVGKGVLFREVSSVQRCPYREVPLYILSWQQFTKQKTTVHLKTPLMCICSKVTHCSNNQYETKCRRQTRLQLYN